MRLPRWTTWPKRRTRCARLGHKWYEGKTGGRQVRFCIRCGKRVEERMQAAPGAGD